MNQWEMEKAFIQLGDQLPSLAQTLKDFYDELIKSGFDDEQSVYLTGTLLQSIMTGGR